MSQAQEWSPSDGGFPYTFFDAINQADGDGVVTVVTSVARTADGTLTPRAAELDSIGEWDSKMELSLVCLGAHCCPAKVGQAGAPRICGRPKSDCSVPGHKKAAGVVEPGWYISAGAKNAGAFEQPRLPIKRDGGPITSGGAAFLIDGDASFKLPKGRWLLAIEAFLAAEKAKAEVLHVEIPEYDEEPEAEGLSPDSYEQISFSHAPGVTFANPPTASTAAPTEVGGTAARATAGAGGSGYGGDGDDDDDEGADDGPSGFGGWGSGSSGGGAGGGGNRRAPGEQPAPATDQEAFLRLVRMAVRGVMSETESQIRDLAAQSRLAGELIEDRVATVERILDSERRALSDTQDALATARRSTAEQNRRIDSVQAQVVDNACEFRARLTTANPPAPPALGNDVARCVHALFNNQGVVPLLRTQFTAFRERLESGGGIECHGVKFASKKQLLSWYEAQNLAHPAIFLDALAIMHGIRATYKDPLDALKEAEIQGRVKHQSTLESALKNSFAYPVPPILTGGKKDTEGLGMFDVLKGALKTYQAWKPDDEPSGVAMQIEEGVENVYTRWAEYRESITTDPNLTVLTAGLLTDSKLFLIELV
jgi:hypothetical protein